MKFILLIIFAYLSFNCSIKKYNCDYYRNNFLSGKYFFENKNDSIKQLNDLVEINKKYKCFDLYVITGMFNYELANDTFAKIDFLNAFKLNSNSIIVNYYLSSLYSEVGKIDSALWYINKAISTKNINGNITEIHPFFSKNFDIGYYDLIYFKGSILFSLGQYSLAKIYFLRTLTSPDLYIESSEYLKNIYFELGNNDSAYYYKNLIKTAENTPKSR